MLHVSASLQNRYSPVQIRMPPYLICAEVRGGLQGRHLFVSTQEAYCFGQALELPIIPAPTLFDNEIPRCVVYPQGIVAPSKEVLWFGCVKCFPLFCDGYLYILREHHAKDTKRRHP
jgi:hypothetical protein